MSRFNRRNKVVSIRLSMDEYTQLQNLCVSKGAESLSELARAGMKLLLMQESENGHAAMESRVKEMHSRVDTLDREVARLSTLIGVERAGM